MNVFDGMEQGGAAGVNGGEPRVRTGVVLEGRAKQWLESVSNPFGRAEERRVGGGQEHCKMLLLRELACGSCLTEESEVNEGSSAAPPLARAAQVARSEAKGHGLGAAFLWPTFLWRSKET